MVIDFLHLLTDRSVALLANPRGEPRLAAASSEKAGLLELFRLPLPLRDQVIGALNLFSAGGGPLGAADRAGAGRRGHHQAAARARRAPPRDRRE